MRGLRLGFGVGVGGGIVSAYPSLIMDFVPTAGIEVERSSRTFDQLIDFTRTSSATYVDATGKIVSTPASRNLLTFTQEFDNAAWTKGDASVSANTAVAPDGTSTADTLAETATTAIHSVLQTVSSVSAAQHVFSVYLKKGTGATAPDWVQLTFGGVSTGYVNFNLSTGAIGVASSATGAITSVGSGWYRCSVIVTVTVAGAASAQVVFTNNTDSATRRPSYAGATTSDVFLWGAQLEQASAATDYTRNNGGVYPPRFDYDPVTLAPKGLLIEEQRTNLLTYSEQFDNASWAKTRSSITANATTSPDGTVDADKLVEDTTASNTHQVGQTFSATSGTSYSFSVYLKAAERTWAFLQLSSNMFADAAARSAYINLSTGAVGTTAGSPTVTVVDAGGGWWRVTLAAAATATASAGALVYLATGNNGAFYTGDGTSGIYIWGAQLEAGSFATSYIPTVASQVTRTADVATITGANFSQWYNQSEGAIVAEWDSLSSSAGVANISDGTTSNRITVQNDNSFQGAVIAGGAAQTSLDDGTLAATNKVAFAYKADNFALSLNGSAAVTDTSGSLPSVDRLILGANGAGTASFLNGHIRTLSYYNTRLSNTQLQALTA